MGRIVKAAQNNRQYIREIKIASLISLGMVFFITVIEFIDGALFGRLSTLNYSTLFILMAVSFTGSIRNFFHLYVMSGFIFVLIFSILVRHFYSVSTSPALFLDIQYLIRSTLLMLLAMNLFAIIHFQVNQDYLKNWALFQWAFITLAILLHAYANIGADTLHGGNIVKRGYFSFFQSGNQIMAIYIVSWWCVSLLFRVGLVIKVVLAIATLFVIFATGSRSGVVVLVTMLIFSLVDDKMMKNRAIGLLLYIALAASLVYIYMNLDKTLYAIMNIFIDYSSEGDKIASKLHQLNIVTIAFSGRDIHIANAIEIFKSFSVSEWMFGIGVHDFSHLLGSFSSTEESTIAENDFIDILGAYGLTGIVAHYGIIVTVLVVLFKLRFASDIDPIFGKALTGGILILLLFSISSGHIFMSPFSSIIIGMLAGVVISSRWSERAAVPINEVSHSDQKNELVIER